MNSNDYDEVHIWIVDDAKKYRESATKAVEKACSGEGLRPSIFQWDGGELPEHSLPAHLIVLDLNLKRHGKGLERIADIPGFSHANRFGPFVVIWSHYDGDVDFGDVKDGSQDRIVRTYWKSRLELEDKLAHVLRRFKAEGVLFPKNG